MGAFPAQVIVFARCRILVFDGRSKELSVPYAEHNRFTVDFSSTPQTAVVPLPTDLGPQEPGKAFYLLLEYAFLPVLGGRHHPCFPLFWIVDAQ